MTRSLSDCLHGCTNLPFFLPRAWASLPQCACGNQDPSPVDRSAESTSLYISAATCDCATQLKPLLGTSRVCVPGIFFWLQRTVGPLSVEVAKVPLETRLSWSSSQSCVFNHYVGLCAHDKIWMTSDHCLSYVPTKREIERQPCRSGRETLYLSVHVSSSCAGIQRTTIRHDSRDPRTANDVYWYYWTCRICWQTPRVQHAGAGSQMEPAISHCMQAMAADQNTPTSSSTKPTHKVS